MAPFNCCGFRRTVSPEPEPAVLIDTSRTGGRFTLSSHTPSRAESQEDVSNIQPIQEIFTTASKSNAACETSAASGNDIASVHKTESGVRHRDSNRRLHEVASKVRKRMSRDSGMSHRSSKTSLSDDNNKRREELKRALHQRVQADIDEGSNISDGSYDDDAVPIKTPKGSWGRHQGSIHISPKHLSSALRRSDSPSAYAELDPRALSQAYAPNNTAVALSRMLVQRGSNLARESEEQPIHSAVNSRRVSKAQRYSFSDEDGPIQVPKKRSHSPLGRSDTVLHIPSSTKALDIDVTNPELLNTARASSISDLRPLRPMKVRDSAAGEDSRLSTADACQGALPIEAKETHRSTLGSARLPGVYDTRIRPASEQLLHGASGLWGHPFHSKHTNTNSTTDTHTSSSNGHFCNPGSEEMSFGGTDGKDYSPPASENHAGFSTSQRVRSEGSDPIHLYDMHIPQRLASKSLLPSVSLPQLEHRRRDRSYTSGSSSRLFSVMPRSQPSSSMSTNGRPYTTPATHVSSSVYSSGSLPPSPPDSNLHINSLSDRLYYLEVFQPSQEIVSVPASRPKSVDLDNLERRTVETSYHSSNESLMNRELAAAETRIPPARANTLPKYSRFREDLGRISAELALTNPPRRRASNLDGARSPINEDALSVWERALREHSQEDKAIAHTRIGSTYSDSVGPRHLDPKTAASDGQKVRRRSSFLGSNDRRVPEPLEGAQLQAHLDAYDLSPRRQKTRQRPALEDAKRSRSALRASSWARYPSHTRPERSTSPAGVADQVYSRDFAITPPATMPKVPEHESSPLSNGNKRSKTTTFRQQILSTISSLYKSQSQELQRRLANEARGHRSSISEGGKLEYPELEMLGSISPPMPSPDISTKLELEEHFRKASEPQTHATTQSGQISRKQSQDWAREYQDCIGSGSKVKLPTRPPPAVIAGDRDSRWSQGSSEDVVDVSSRKTGKSNLIAPKDGRVDGLGGVTGLRGSRLGFQKSVQVDERMARDRVETLGLR